MSNDGWITGEYQHWPGSSKKHLVSQARVEKAAGIRKEQQERERERGGVSRKRKHQEERESVTAAAL